MTVFFCNCGELDQCWCCFCKSRSGWWLQGGEVSDTVAGFPFWGTQAALFCRVWWKSKCQGPYVCVKLGKTWGDNAVALAASGQWCFIHAVPLSDALPQTGISHCASPQQRKLDLMVSMPQDLKCMKWFLCLTYTWYLSCPLTAPQVLEKTGWFTWQSFDPRQGGTETLLVSTGVGTQWKLNWFFYPLAFPHLKNTPLLGQHQSFVTCVSWVGRKSHGESCI